MKKYAGDLVVLMEVRWNDLYEEAVAIHEKVKNTPSPDGDPSSRFISSKDHAKATKVLGELVAMSNVMIEWGDKLKKCEDLRWSKDFLAALVGFKGGQELDHKIEEEIKTRINKFAKA